MFMQQPDNALMERLHEVLLEASTRDEEEATLIQLLNAIDNTLVVTNPHRPDNPIMWVNRQFETLTGYRLDEVAGRNCRFLQGDDRDQEGIRQLRRAVRSGESACVELRNYRKDGSMFWNELYISPVHGANGEIILFLGVQNDITERKRLQAESERIKNTLLESARDAIVVTGPKLSEPGPAIRYVNPAFERMTGYTLSEVKGKTPRMLQGQKTDRVVLRRLRERLEAGHTFQGETVNYDKGGEPFQMEWTIAPVEDDAGEVTNWLAVQRDVTERRRLERELLRVSAREQARLARDLHDNVQQNLLATKMFAGNLRKAYGGDPELEKHFRDFERYLDAAVGNLRAISRGLSPGEFEYQGFLVGLERLVRSFDELHPASFTFRYEHPLTIDDTEKAEHLYRIVQEALSNVVKHAEARTVQVSLSHSADKHILQVSDDGKGLPPEAKGRGAGIGLSSMRYRAEVIGAELHFRHNDQGGVTVECVFNGEPIPDL